MRKVSTTLPKILAASVIKPKPWQKGEFERARENFVDGVSRDRKARGRAKLVATTLARDINRKYAAAFPSFSRIAKRLGMNRSDVKRDIDHIVSLGHLIKVPRLRRRGGADQYDGTGEFYYVPPPMLPRFKEAMLVLHQHRVEVEGGSMLVKSGVDVGERINILLAEQGVTGPSSEDSLKDKNKKELAPSARSPMARVEIIELKIERGIRENALRAKEGSKEESPLPSSDSPPSSSLPPSPPSSARPPFTLESPSPWRTPLRGSSG